MKRFIAGASCPQCNQQDSLFFESKNQDQVFCSRCDYQAQRASGPSGKAEAKIQEEKPPTTEQGIKWH